MTDAYTEENMIARFTNILTKYESGKTNLGNPPTALFDKNGRFNPHNWNSGQDPRAILCERDVYDERMDEPFESWYDEEGTDGHITSYGVFWSGEKRHENQTYVIMNVITSDKDSADTYIVSWYKSRGCTEILTKNGHKITLNEYVGMLNTLEKAGFFSAAC